MLSRLGCLSRYYMCYCPHPFCHGQIRILLLNPHHAQQLQVGGFKLPSILQVRSLELLCWNQWVQRMLIRIMRWYLLGIQCPPFTLCNLLCLFDDIVLLYSYRLSVRYVLINNNNNGVFCLSRVSFMMIMICGPNLNQASQMLGCLEYHVQKHVNFLFRSIDDDFIIHSPAKELKHNLSSDPNKCNSCHTKRCPPTHR